MSLSELALRRPVTMLMVYATLLVLGVIAYIGMPREFLPILTGPHFWIQIPYRNATPTEVEKTIAIPAEELLQTVPKLSRVKTVSQNSFCSILLEFDWGADMDYAYLDVKDRLDRLKDQLPRESRDYAIWRFSSNDIEVMFLGFSWEGPVEELYTLAEGRIKTRLQRIEGVGSVSVWGHEPKKVYINLDQDLLKGYGVSLYELVLRLERNNFTLGSGEVLEGGTRYLVRALNEFRSLEDLENFRINNKGLRLKDVAMVRYGYPEQVMITRMDGRASISVGIKKESGANTVEVCETVRAEMELLTAGPILSEIHYTVIFDQAEFIMNSFRDLRNAGLWGGIFAVLVLYFFLRRALATMVVAVAIPISIVVAVIVMYFCNMTMNVVSMVGLMLGVGMLVDNSIVVSENIFRLRDKGMSPLEASEKGSREVALAILASTLTTVIVFLPMIFMDMGMLKVYTREVGVAISLSLVASLFVALTFIPLVSSRLPRRRRAGTKNQLVGRLVAHYGWGLRWALKNRSRVVSLLIVLIVLTILVPVRLVPQKGEPTGDVRRVLLDVVTRGVQDQERLKEAVAEVESTLFAHQEELEVDHIFTQSGHAPDRARVHVFLREDDKTLLTTEEAEERILEQMPLIPDVTFNVPEHKSLEGGSENDVNVLFTGENPLVLERIAREMVEKLKGTEGILRAETDIEPGFDEIQVTVDRSLADKNKVNPMIAAQTIGFGLRGYPMKNMKEKDKEVEVIIQLEEEDRKDLSKLKELQLITEDGRLIPLGTAAYFREAPGQKMIHRSEGRRTVKVRATTSGAALSIVKKRVEGVLGSLRLPPGYRSELGRDLLDLEATQQAFRSAILLSIILIYFLLGALFESYIHPFTILVSVPLALMGSYWVMFFTGSTMDVTAYIGLILMVGIVVNNAIVIMDHMNQLRRSGMEREEAILKAGEDRVRPVLMTATTTILGLFPLAFGGVGIGGAGMFASLGKAVVGGLAISTLLTLFVVPVFYTFMEDAAIAVRRFFSMALAGKATPRKLPFL